MNEFIVWSESGQRFLDIHEFSVSAEGKIVLLRDGKIFDVVESGQEYFLFRGIGKTDIEGNKIYADSSIVEFDYRFNDGNSKLIGYFTYDSEQLRYKIIAKEKDNNTKWNTTFDNHVSNLKIIGNTQQNPELLKGDEG